MQLCLQLSLYLPYRCGHYFSSSKLIFFWQCLKMKDALCVQRSLLAFSCSAERQRGLDATLTLLIHNFLSHT